MDLFSQGLVYKNDFIDTYPPTIALKRALSTTLGSVNGAVIARFKLQKLTLIVVWNVWLFAMGA